MMRRVVGLWPMCGAAAVAVAALTTCGNDDASSTVNTELVPSTTTAPATTVFIPSALPAELIGQYGRGRSALEPMPDYLEVNTDGTGRVFMDDVDAVAQIGVEVDGRHMVVTSTDGSWGCDAATVGRYDWIGYADGSLDVRLVDDPCSARSDDLVTDGDEFTPGVHGRWFRLESPIIDVSAETPSVTEGSPIGTITWIEQATALTEADVADTQGRPLSDDVIGTDDGFYEHSVIDGTSHLFWSPDGMTWTAIPTPPQEFNALEAVDATVLVADAWDSDGSPIWPTEVSATSDRGSSWRTVAVDPAPAQTSPAVVGGWAAGGAGIIVPTETPNDATDYVSGGPVWVYGPGRFEMVEPPWLGTAGTVRAWALDSWFIVQSGVDERDVPTAGQWWTSPNGRTWTPMRSVPCGLTVTYTIADTVYADACDRPVMSDDAGETWAIGVSLPLPWQRLASGGFVSTSGDGFTCSRSVYASDDGANWHRVLNLWPNRSIGTTVSGDTILAQTASCDNEISTPDSDWIGTVSPAAG